MFLLLIVTNYIRKNVFYAYIQAYILSYSLLYFGGKFRTQFTLNYFQWYFYVRQRDRAEEWKCQPKKFMSPELELHEIIFGSATLFLNSTLTATIACYISNGGYSTIYYNLTEYPIWWLILQFPLIFIYQVRL